MTPAADAMALDDLPLGATGPAGSRGPAGRSPARWIVVGAVAVIAGALLALWWMSRAQPSTATPAPTTATDVAAGSNRPKRQPMDLPALDVSDVFLRDLLLALSRHPLFGRVVATTGLIRAAVLAVEQIGDGRTPAVPLRVLRPTGRLAILGTDSGRIDPASYARWNGATEALASLDPAAVAQFYVNVKPLFDEAYRDLGHPDGDFDQSIVRAIQMLAATPEPAADPELFRRPGYFSYADASLRSLPPVQKQFLLIGPDNRQRVLDWLRRLAHALDLKLD